MTFQIPTAELIAAIESVAEARSDEFTLLQCSRARIGSIWQSHYEPKSVDQLTLGGHWQYFIQSRAATPVLPAPTPLSGIGWPAAFACNGLILLHHPEPVVGAIPASPQSSIGIVHRVANTKTGGALTHSNYDEIYKRLKATLRAKEAAKSLGGHS